ncbi:MAG: PAS domain-containing sensor histidine kinase [Bacteroidota bacterium]|nr:PAS domain-containing sensor histidine kinase [Bacteroidota bacterium]
MNHSDNEISNQVVFDKSPLPIIIIQLKDLKFLEVNPKAVQQFGYSKQEFLQLNFKDIVYPEDCDKAEQAIKKIKSGQDVKISYRNIKKNKDIIEVCVVATLIKYKNVTAILKIATDVTEINKAEALIDRQKFYFDELFNATPFAVSLSDLNDNIIKINKSFTNLFQFNEEEACGKKLSIIIPKKKKDKYKETFHKLEYSNFTQIETIRQRKDKKIIDVLLVNYPHVSNDILIGYYCLYIDISEKKQAEKQLLDYNYELEKTNSELDHFVYSISHDLRAPLTNIMGLLNIIGMEKDLDQQKILIDKARNAINKLDDFIKIILDYSWNTRLEIKFTHIDFEELIAEAWENYSYLEGTKKIKLDIRLQQEVPFISDKGRISIILNNVISNALIYCNPAEINSCIEIEIIVDNEFAHIVINDNGIGIEKKHHKKVFEMFFRASQVSSGSGLGLYIVKDVVAKLGGNIKLKSELDKGTAILIDLPNQ